MKNSSAPRGFACTAQILLVMICACLLSACGFEKELQISGRTMGTTYTVKWVGGFFARASSLQNRIDQRLEAINASMSTYRSDSEISRLNGLSETQDAIAVSDDFWQVMTVAARIHQLSAGAWDGTVAPLVNLWGFGSQKRTIDIPSPAAIADALAKVGFSQIERLSEQRLRKLRPEVTLNLASIAKGFAVDAVALVLRQNDIENFLVEIGGEIYAAGQRRDGKPWQVGINHPQKGAAFDAVYRIVALSNRALATSGDYRNYFEVDGKTYSHIIDPRTGYPVANGVVSVTVIADNCTLADGLATAITVMGLETGLALVNRLPNVECLIVQQTAGGVLSDHYSNGFGNG